MNLDKIKRSLDLSSNQLRFLLVMAVMAVGLGTWALIISYSSPTNSSLRLPVFFGDPERQFTGTFIIDPNTAPVDSLELLPGIGTVKANAIVDYRSHTKFTTEVDITDVRGIGPKLYERIKPFLKVKRP